MVEWWLFEIYCLRRHALLPSYLFKYKQKNGPKDKAKKYLITSILKTPFPLRNITSGEVTSCVLLHSVYLLCVCVCAYTCVYIHILILWRLPLGVTPQDTKYTVFWVNLYWNSPAQLLWLMKKPQRFTSLSLPCTALQACAPTVCMGSEEGTQVLKLVRGKHYGWVGSLYLIPHWNVRILFGSLNVTFLCPSQAPL